MPHLPALCRVCVVSSILTGAVLFAQTPAPRAPAAPAVPSAPSAPAAAAPATPTAATPENAAAFVGDWTLEGQGQNGPATFALTVKVDGGKIVADISSAMQAQQAVTDIKKAGAALVLRYGFDYQGTAVPVVITITPGGDKVAVQFDFADGAYTMEGAATKKAK